MFFEDQDYATSMYWLKAVAVSMVLSPAEYRQLSFEHKSGQLIIRSIKQHEFFVGLSGSLAKSKEWYLDSFKNVLSEDAINSITAAWLTGTKVGREEI